MRDPRAVPGCTSSAAATHSCEASMLELTRIASSSAAGAARGRERGPQRAQRRPSLERVGVLAGARPADGPSGCNPSAPSCWCSPCPPPARLIDEPGVAHTSRPPRATTTQPTHRLLSVDGRRPLDAALEAVLDGCQAAALGSSVAAGRSLRRPPCPCLGLRRGPGRPAHEVRTAAGRRAS